MKLTFSMSFIILFFGMLLCSCSDDERNQQFIVEDEIEGLKVKNNTDQIVTEDVFTKEFLSKQSGDCSTAEILEGIFEDSMEQCELGNVPPQACAYTLVISYLDMMEAYYRCDNEIFCKMCEEHSKNLNPLYEQLLLFHEEGSDVVKNTNKTKLSIARKCATQCHKPDNGVFGGN